MDKVTIRETRRLHLPAETALDVVLEFDRQQGGSLWKHAVSETRLVVGPDPMMVVTVRPPGSPPQHREFDPPTLAAAIIHYCVRARIPLPRQGRKGITIVSDGVEFTIDSVVKLDKRHVPQLGTGGDVPTR